MRDSTSAKFGTGLLRIHAKKVMQHLSKRPHLVPNDQRLENGHSTSQCCYCKPWHQFVHVAPATGGMACLSQAIHLLQVPKREQGVGSSYAAAILACWVRSSWLRIFLHSPRPKGRHIEDLTLGLAWTIL